MASKRSRVVVASAVAVVAWGVVGSPWAAADYVKIADTSTPIPGQAGTFTGFGLPAITRTPQVEVYYFRGAGAGGLSGIYKFD